MWGEVDGLDMGGGGWPSACARGQYGVSTPSRWVHVTPGHSNRSTAVPLWHCHPCLLATETGWGDSSNLVNRWQFCMQRTSQAKPRKGQKGGDLTDTVFFFQPEVRKLAHSSCMNRVGNEKRELRCCPVLLPPKQWSPLLSGALLSATSIITSPWEKCSRKPKYFAQLGLKSNTCAWVQSPQ